jgi:hypothetical protein
MGYACVCVGCGPATTLRGLELAPAGFILMGR